MNAPTSRRRLFRQENRLRSKADFQRVFREGKRGSAKGLVLFVCAAETEYSRLGLAISRKFGNAVARNRARRLIREAFRLRCPEFETVYDIVAQARREQFPGCLKEVEEAMMLSLQRAKSSRSRSRLGPNKGPGKKPKKTA